MIVRALMNTVRKIKIGPRLNRSPSRGVSGVEARFAHSNYVKSTACQFK